MLVVLAEEHRRNFRKLLAGAEALSGAHAQGSLSDKGQENLLRFYAVEVGLKYLLNVVERVPFRHEAAAGSTYVEKYSHKIAQMVVDLRVPASRVPALAKADFKCIGGFDDGTAGQTFPLHAAQEAWRYGLTVEAADEGDILAYLGGITAYLSEEIAP